VKRFLRILGVAGKNWVADNIFLYAAAVSFSTLFSLAPVTIVAVTVAGFFFGQETAAREMEKQIASLVGPSSAELVQATVKATEKTRTSAWSTVAGAGLLLFGATTVFGQLQRSLNQIWRVRTKPSRSGWFVLVMQRLLSLAMVITLGFLLLVSLIISTALATVVAHYGEQFSGSAVLLKAVDLSLGLLIVAALFALVFKVLPDVTLRWRDVWMGAALAAGLFTMGRYFIALYLSHSTVTTIYGAAGSLVALLIWVYYSCALLFYGVEFIRAYREACGLQVEPKQTAVLVREEIGPDGERRAKA
jgi:membrane protein